MFRGTSRPNWGILGVSQTKEGAQHTQFHLICELISSSLVQKVLLVYRLHILPQREVGE